MNGCETDVEMEVEDMSSTLAPITVTQNVFVSDHSFPGSF